MCLLINKNKSKIKTAENNITVYKIMLQTPGKEWITPYRRMVVDKPVKGTVMTAKGEINIIQNPGLYCIYSEVEGGVIHAYDNFESASIMSRGIISNYHVAVWKMVIPKDTTYIEGICKEIAAKQLVLRKIMSDEEVETCYRRALKLNGIKLPNSK